MALCVNIRKRLGSFFLDVNFEAEKEALGLLGASGCGKSVTLRCIAGIMKPDEGHIELDGKVFFDSEKKINLPPQERRVGYLFQQYALFPNMTVAQNIGSGVKNKSCKKEITAQLLHTFQLQNVASSRPAQLSGGQQQRTALARILASDPEILLLDEPFSALDSYLKWQMELELADTLVAFGGTSVFVSHSREEVYRLCDTVSVLSHGCAEPKITVKSLFEDPRTISSCLLSGCKNFSRIKAVDGTRVKALDWGVILDVNQEILSDATHMGVRSHAIAPFSGLGGNNIPCKVVRVVDDVFSTVVMLSTPNGGTGYSQLCMEMDKKKWAAFGNPFEIILHIEPADIMLLKD